KEGPRPHRQRGQLEGFVQAFAIRPWRDRRGNRRRDSVRRLRTFGLHKWVGYHHRRRPFSTGPSLLNEECMSHLTTDDGIKLYYEETGKGIPIVFIHEFAGDCRSWEQQVRYFGRYYRCITVNARGYPPSDVPTDGKMYSQDRARDDIRAVLDALKIDTAHVVGLSMGGFAALHFGFTYHKRARSLVIAGCGYGAEPDKKEKFRAEGETAAPQ